MSNDAVVMFEGTIYENGYGWVAQKVMRDKDLSVQAKAIYSYICSMAGNPTDIDNRKAFPSVSIMKAELGIKSQDTFYKHMNQLKEKGYLKVVQEKEKGKFKRNIYKVVAVPKEEPLKENKPCSKKSTTANSPQSKNWTSEKSTSDNSTSENRNTNRNSSNRNSFISNIFNNQSIKDSLKSFIIKHEESLDDSKIKTIIELDGLIDDQSYQMVILNILDNKEIKNFKKYLLKSIENHKKDIQPTEENKTIRTEVIPDWMDQYNFSENKRFSDDQPEEKKPSVSKEEFEKEKKALFDRIRKYKDKNAM